MATDLFDPSKIDAAVGEAFSTKPTRPAAPAPTTPAPLRTNNPGALMPRGQLAQFGTMDEGLRALDQNLQAYGKRGINTLEGVINTWSPPTGKGNTPEGTRNYINHVARVTGLKPDQAIDLNDPLVRLQLTAGITQFESGPNAIYGQRQAAAAPSTSATPSTPAAPRQAPAATPGALTVEDLMKPEAVNAAVAEAMNEPPKKGKVANLVTSVLRGSAALADTVLGVVPAVAGMATYAGARAVGQTPEQAGQTQAKVTGALERPVGRAFGVTETPEYKGEFSQRVMDTIGKFVGESAEAISKKTGIAVPEVEYYLNLGMTSPAMLRGTKPGQAIAREAGYVAEAAKQAGGKAVEAAATVTPAPVRTAVRATTEAFLPGTTKPPAPVRLGQLTPEDRLRTQMQDQTGAAAIPNVVSNTRGSVGAMAVPDTTILNQAIQNASPKLREALGNIPIDKANAPAIMRMIEADSLYVPMQLTEGMATGSLKYLSDEKNLRAKYPEIADRIQQLNQNLIDNFNETRTRAAPDVFSTTKIEASQGIIDAYKALDAEKNLAIEGAYKKLRDSAGGELPVNASVLLKNIDGTLSKELLLTDGRGISQYRELRNKAKDGQMTFDEYLAMRRNLSRLSAEAKDGNTRQAARLMVQELDNLPLTQETATLKPLADEARNLAKQRFSALKADPAYKAAVNDAVPADKYLEKFVINGVNKNINTMVDTLGRDSPAHQQMKAGTLFWLKDQARIFNDRGNFSENGFKRGLNKLDSVKNFQTIFDPETQLQLRTMDNVAHYVKFQPEGHWINNSNTWTNLKAYGAKGIEQLGNIAGFKALGGIPVGTIITQKAIEAGEKKRVRKALEVGAGSTLQDLSRQGQPKQSNQPMSERREPTLD